MPNATADTDQIIKESDKIDQEIQTRLFERFGFWLDHEILTWRWWLGLGLSVVPWIVFWCAARNKPYFDRLLYVCLYVIMVSVILDTLGDQYGLWHYRYNVIPAIPTYFPWDFTLMPLAIITMLIIKPRVNPWIKAIVFALLASFVGEPLFNWADVYVLEKWKYIYSVPIQIVLYLTAHLLFTTRNKFSPYGERK